MQNIQAVSKQTRNNWLIDASLAIAALVAALSGIYFLYLPNGGFQGGRNPMYGVTLFFERHTWDLLHTWSGVAMIAAALIHFSIHWQWVVGMVRRVWKEITGRGSMLNARGRFNVWLDAGVAVSFALSAASGVYFLIFPASHNFVWDMIHTWSSVTMIILALVHFAIHWQWVVKVTRRIFTRRAGVHAPAATLQTEHVLASE
ncbi:MAG: DUF4405 domain-containing protein [Anaerolineae bacterium]|nr:DUF4405 domain-containing protein [Anaerolineae bacterium]